MMIELVSDHVRVEIADQFGAEVRFIGRPDGENVLAWYDWATPLRASESTTYGSSSLDWASDYRGGWQELFPNAGADCSVDDVPLPFHGEVSRTAWEVSDHRSDAVTLTVGARLPLALTRRMSLASDAPVLKIEETVSNESDATVPFVWVHHPAFVATPGTKIDLPSATIHVDSSYTTELGDLEPGAEGRWPFIRDKCGTPLDLSVVPVGVTDRLCYATELEQTWAAVRTGGAGVALAWDGDTHPYGWIWTEVSVPTMPSYGRSQIIAIEPASYWPADGLASAVSDGRAHSLGAGERLSSWLTLSVFDATEAPVTGVDRDGTVHGY